MKLVPLTYTKLNGKAVGATHRVLVNSQNMLDRTATMLRYHNNGSRPSTPIEVLEGYALPTDIPSVVTESFVECSVLEINGVKQASEKTQVFLANIIDVKPIDQSDISLGSLITGKASNDQADVEYLEYKVSEDLDDIISNYNTAVDTI